MKIIKITEIHAERRIDRVLKSLFPDMPMSAMYRHLRTGKIKLNKKKIKPESKTELNDELQLFFDTEAEKIQEKPESSGVDFEKLKNSLFFKKNFKILYEDSYLLALDKPAGIAVHPGSKHYHGKTMLDIAQAYTNGKTKDDFQTQLVHRLDLETSGVLLFAKTPEALRKMNANMKDHEGEKRYYALCRGVLEKDKGTIKVALERTEGRKNTKIIISRGGKDAKMSVTHFEVVKRFKEDTLISVLLETGRMHQIRVHMKSQGHALWGDPHYGDFAFNKEVAKEPYKLKRMFLHAYSFSFEHPITNKRITIEAQLPFELQKLVDSL